MCLLSNEQEFSSRTHLLRQWYGLNEFIIILAPNEEEEDILTADFATSLMSALSVVLTNAKKQIARQVHRICLIVVVVVVADNFTHARTEQFCSIWKPS